MERIHFTGGGEFAVVIITNVSIESGGGLTWKNGFDICPNSLKENAEAKVQVA